MRHVRHVRLAAESCGRLARRVHRREEEDPGSVASLVCPPVRCSARRLLKSARCVTQVRVIIGTGSRPKGPPSRRQVGEPRNTGWCTAFRSRQAPRAADRRLRSRNGKGNGKGNGIPRRPISRAKTFDEKLPPFGDGRDLVRSSGGPGRRAWLPAFPAQHRGSADNANGSPVPLQDRAAALAGDGSVLAVGAAGTCVARLQPPRPLTPRSSPPSRGPRSPSSELHAPRSVPEARLQSDRWR